MKLFPSKCWKFQELSLYYFILQENDFLGAVFHMYENEDEDGDANKSDKDVLSSSKMAKQR